MQYYVQDTFKLGDLTLNGGWKGFQVIERANAVVPGTLAGGRITSTDWFQPSVGAAYKIGAHGEAFGSFSQSTQAFVAAGTTGPFSTTRPVSPPSSRASSRKARTPMRSAIAMATACSTARWAPIG
jgi:iron complex outermembrane receptor protein